MVNTIYNFNCKEFNNIFNDDIYLEVINSCNSYKLIVNNTLNFKNKDAKNLLTYFTILYTIKYIKLVINDNKNVVVVQPSLIHLNDATVIFDTKTINNIINKTLHIIKKSYPNNIIFLKVESCIDNPDILQIIFNKCNKILPINNKQLKDIYNQTIVE